MSVLFNDLICFRFFHLYINIQHAVGNKANLQNCLNLSVINSILFIVCMLMYCYLFKVEMFDGSYFTHSSLVRSCVSLTRSLKHPKEYMLSRTSGSSSVRDTILFTHTRRGGGCSGQGSLRPPLIEKRQRNRETSSHRFNVNVSWSNVMLQYKCQQKSRHRCWFDNISG